MLGFDGQIYWILIMVSVTVLNLLLCVFSENCKGFPVWLTGSQRINFITIFVVCCILPSVLWRCWLGDRKGIRPVKKQEWCGAGVVVCLEQGADLHMAQLMPLPLTVSCFSEIQIGFNFLVPAHLGSPRKRAVKRVCVCVCFVVWKTTTTTTTTILWPLYRSACASQHLQLRTGGFFGCKILLPAWPCWRHPAHALQ